MGFVFAFATVIAFVGQLSLVLTPFAPWKLAIALGVSGAAALRPGITICGFIFILPIFGNRPDSAQAALLTFLGCSLQLGLGLRRILFTKDGSSRITSAPLRIAALYVLISCLSLFPHPILDAARQFFSAQPSFHDLYILLWNSAAIFIAPESSPLYSLRSVIWTIFSFSLCLEIFRIGRVDRRMAIWFSCAVLGGLVISLGAGLLDYYGAINLRPLRSLDPVVNPNDVEFRLQSWFGHSGWFAEFVTLGIPFSLIIFALPIAGWARVSLVLGIMMVGEFALILTFQRGGWLSYPLTLVAIWSAIYVQKQLHKDRGALLAALKASAIKILISLPLTIAFSFLLLKAVGTNVPLDEYAQRFKDISKTSDRSAFVEAAFLLGRLNPIFGLGSESFPREYEREFMNSDGAYDARIILPLHGSAHNVYAQTFAGKGVLGLLALLAVVYVCIRSATRSIFSAQEQGSVDRLLCLITACAMCSFLIYGTVQEIFYVQSLQYLFFIAIGICAIAVTADGQGLVSQRATILLAVVFLAHLVWSAEAYPRLTSSRELQEYGCYPKEHSPRGEEYAWCGPRAAFLVHAEKSASGSHGRLLLIMAPAHDKSPLTLQVWSCGQKLTEIAAAPGSHLTVAWDAPPSCPLDKPDQKLLQIRSARYFIPALGTQRSKDRRVLSYRVIFGSKF